MEKDYISKFGEFFELYYSETYKYITEGQKSIIVDFSSLVEFDIDLAQYVLDNPTEAIKNAEEVLISKGFELFVRFKNLPNTEKISIRDVRSKDLNKFLFFEGIIRQATDVRPQVKSAIFDCKCGNRITQVQEDDKFKKPICSCGSKDTKLVEKHLIDTQKLVIEEASEDLDGGSQPRRMVVILSNDLVEPKQMKKTTPGNKVRIYGVVKDIQKHSKFGGVSTVFDLITFANYIEPIQEDYSDIKITNKDIDTIKEFSKKDNLFEVLTSSIAPSILGLQEIKLALLIQLFGGVRRVLRDGTLFREMIHVLIIGDPGTSKSKISTYIAKAAPKARYLAGKGASAVGLTATVLKDEFTQGYVLEAGALVLSHNGILVLDELDKMSEDDTSALHEALEQGSISVAKANVQAKLNCRTSLLACANPKFGRFDVYKTIADQIDMPPALINRFDLIFALRDIPNEDKDEAIARHILSFDDSSFATEIVSQDFLRKYIAYAKQSIAPRMTSEAEKEIRTFYVTLRNSNRDNTQAIPISPRQLEALVRLAQSSARIRLSNTVDVEDAKRAITLLRYSLSQVGIDPQTGELDIDVLQTGIATSRRNKINTILKIIEEMETQDEKSVNVEAIIRTAHELNIDRIEVEDILLKLTKEGRAFNPRSGFIQRI